MDLLEEGLKRSMDKLKEKERDKVGQDGIGTYALSYIWGPVYINCLTPISHIPGYYKAPCFPIVSVALWFCFYLILTHRSCTLWEDKSCGTLVLK